MATITALVITHNEEANIDACLRSLAFATALLVVDSGSTDNTCAIARSLGATVEYHPWAGYAEQKNYAHTLVKTDWVLSIDADERVSPELREEILGLLNALPPNSPVVAYRIPIRDWMFGKFVRYGSWPHQRHIRLYRSGKVRWVGTVHEWQEIDGPIDSLSQPILHYSHTTIGKFIEKLNKYTELEAQAMFAQGQRVSLTAAVLGAVRAFLGQYVRLQGFRDGGHGLILAVLMAVYYFVARAKLWSRWYMQGHGSQ